VRAVVERQRQPLAARAAGHEFVAPDAAPQLGLVLGHDLQHALIDFLLGVAPVAIQQRLAGNMAARLILRCPVLEAPATAQD